MDRINLYDYLSEEDVIHSQRVGDLAFKLSKRLGFSKNESDKIKFVGIYHDIGKVHICKSILQKVDQLDGEEFEVLKKHPAYSAKLLCECGFDWETSRLVLHHHENYDGSGYPFGLKGNQIPIESQIISICDYVDNKIHERANRKSYMTKFETINHLFSLRNKKFQDEVVKEMIMMLAEELQSVYQNEFAEIVPKLFE